MAQIFISYSRKDLDFVRKLAGDLERAGYEAWWDLSDLRGGDDWVKTIPAAIAASQYVIVVLTPDAVESEWVRKEYTQGLSLRKKIVPILLKPGPVPFALNTINFVNFTSGEYEDRFKELLSALDFTGKPPAVDPYRKPLLALPPAVKKFGIPIGIGLLLLLALLARAAFPPAPPPDPTATTTPTVSTPVVNFTPTLTVSPTNDATATPTPTNTEPPDTATPTRTSTLSPTPTVPPAFVLPICVYGDSRVNVREGPGFGFVTAGAIEGNGTRCPFFSAYIRNRDQEIWFQLAPDQGGEFEPFAGKWIYQSGLAAADRSLLPLPICIYSPADSVEMHIIPSQESELLENTLTTDGNDCPFFDTRIENEQGMWYRVAPNQKEKQDQFGQYAGGWIHAEFLVVDTLNLPALTLTATPTSSQTSTPSSTPTRTPTPTITPSETPSETPVPTETETPTDTPAP